jgi:hypothetical protein
MITYRLKRMRTFRSKRIRVCNAVETSNYKPLDGGDWIDYWEQKSGKDRNTVVCQNPKCNHSDVVGAHVVSIDYATPYIYIAPLCRDCNNKKESLEPFYIDPNLCVPMPDECLFEEDGKAAVIIHDANSRIIEANRSNVASKKKKQPTVKKVYFKKR